MAFYDIWQMTLNVMNYGNMGIKNANNSFVFWGNFLCKIKKQKKLGQT